jgi:putrescine transport system ATP-binding protein
MTVEAAAGHSRGLAIGAVRRKFAPWTDPSAKPLIRFEAIVKKFGDFTAVDGVSLDIYEREFFCLLGPSGCGKTTLMRMLAGFERPSSGRVILAGEDIAGIPPHRLPVNMMFQSYALFPHMTVEKNVAFGLKQDGVPKDEIATRVAAILKQVQLTGMERRRPDQLSGGQRQRVALARALVKRPKVLLLDEPLGALDKKLREETQFELMDLQVELGITFLMVTHDQDEAMTMADRIGMMSKGRLVQVGTPGEIYEQPVSRAVAEFVGDVSIFEGRILDKGPSGWRIESGTAGATLEVAGADGFKPGELVAVAVRPEKMRMLQDAPDAGTVNAMPGEIYDIGYLGDWTTYRVQLASGTVIKVSRANASRYMARPITWEDRVWVTFDPDAAVILRS